MATRQQLRALRKKYHLGEFSKKKTHRKARVHFRRVANMARKRKSGRAHKSMGMLERGLYKPTGLVGAALLGAGAATLTEKVINVHPLQGVAVGFVVGGVAGAAGAFARDMLKGINLSGSTGSAGNY